MIITTIKLLPIFAIRFGMKIIKLLGAIILSGFILSCDDFTNLYGPEQPEDPTANDTKCLSVTGSRFEKYYYQLDPASYSTNITLSSPSILGYEFSNGIDPTTHAFNQITLIDMPLRRFSENTSFTHQITGSVAVSGKSGSIYTAYSAPFEKSASISPYRDYNKIEPLNVLNSFTNTPGDLILSYNGNYSSTAKKEDFRVFTMTFSAGFLRSCNDITKFTIPYGSSSEVEFTIDGIYPSDLTATGSAYVSLIPISRNFYQYRDITATFSPGTFITDIEATSIVKSFKYDDNLNTITIIFNDYDFPYIGNVIFYKIGVGEKGDDVPMKSKVVRIEG
jgi:hypothetical protein